MIFEAVGINGAEFQGLTVKGVIVPQWSILVSGGICVKLMLLIIYPSV